LAFPGRVGQPRWHSIGPRRAGQELPWLRRLRGVPADPRACYGAGPILKRPPLTVRRLRWNSRARAVTLHLCRLRARRPIQISTDSTEVHAHVIEPPNKAVS
jgi:hypothetical protein